MPSSKFSSPKRFYKRPAICKKQPMKSGMLWNPTYPPILEVDFRVMDYDPPVNYRFFGNFQIRRKQGLYHYNGRSEGAIEYIVGLAFPIEFLGQWSFQFQVHAASLPGEWFVYEIYLAPDPIIFNTRNIGDVKIAGQDERYFRIYL